MRGQSLSLTALPRKGRLGDVELLHGEDGVVTLVLTGTVDGAVGSKVSPICLVDAFSCLL